MERTGKICAQHGTGIIVRTPLCFGLLTGKIKGDTEFPASHHLSKWPKEQIARWASSVEKFSLLNEGKDRTMTQLALKFCIMPSEVSTVIPGMLTTSEVIENAAVSDQMSLTDYEINAIYGIYSKSFIYNKDIKLNAIKNEMMEAMRMDPKGLNND